jgi:hypothetical protein
VARGSNGLTACGNASLVQFWVVFVDQIANVDTSENTTTDTDMIAFAQQINKNYNLELTRSCQNQILVTAARYPKLILVEKGLHVPEIDVRPEAYLTHEVQENLKLGEPDRAMALVANGGGSICVSHRMTPTLVVVQEQLRNLSLGKNEVSAKFVALGESDSKWSWNQ